MPFGFAVEPDVYRTNSVSSASIGSAGHTGIRCGHDLVVPDVAASRHLALDALGADDDDVLERLEVAHDLVDAAA